MKLKLILTTNPTSCTLPRETEKQPHFFLFDPFSPLPFSTSLFIFLPALAFGTALASERFGFAFLVVRPLLLTFTTGLSIGLVSDSTHDASVSLLLNVRTCGEDNSDIGLS